jgi:hypothetical protein
MSYKTERIFFPTSDGRRMIRKEQSEDFFFFFSFLHFDNPNQTFLWLDLFVNKAKVQCRKHRPIRKIDCKRYSFDF